MPILLTPRGHLRHYAPELAALPPALAVGLANATAERAEADDLTAPASGSARILI